MVSPPASAVLEAAVSCIAERGLDGTSIRQVAARAGVSIGAVQHHFATKDALLVATMRHLEGVYRDRLDADETPGARPAELLRRSVHALVPRDRAERQATSLWLAFVARAAVHGPTAAEHRRVWRRAEDMVAVRVAAVLEEAGAPDDRGAQRQAEAPSKQALDVAAALLALADGLSVAVLLEPDRMSAERAHRMVDAAVDRLVHG